MSKRNGQRLSQIAPGWGGRIRKERERLGFSQTALGDMLRVTKKTVYNFETEATPIGIDAIDALGSQGFDLDFVLFNRGATQQQALGNPKVGIEVPTVAEGIPISQLHENARKWRA